MISIGTLRQKDKGRRVICSDGVVSEEGVITSWNFQYIFVRFDSKSINGQACRPESLTWSFLKQQETTTNGKDSNHQA